MEVFILVLAGWIFSVSLHEYGHAVVAYHAGDVTVKDKGYLSMNPLRYAHPVYSFVMPVVFMIMGGIGLPGGAVYIQDELIRSKQMRSFVSLAGPAMNLALIPPLCLPFWAHLVPPISVSPVGPALALLIALQISAILFNLLPVPGFDGFGALSPFMKYETAHWFRLNASYFYFGLVMIMWNSQEANRLFWSSVFGISGLLGIDIRLIDEGWRLFHFWEN